MIGVETLSEDFFTADDALPAQQPRLLTGLESWAGKTRGGKVREKKTRTKTLTASTFNRARAETSEMMASGEWEGCASRHLLALYDLMHKQVYGVEVTTTGHERHNAVLRLGGFIKREFAGDHQASIDYFRWVWTREIQYAKWCRETNKLDARRMTIPLCTSGSMITDYRLMLARQPRK